ncbi:MAG: tyrosine-type recombinase/integrase [Xanthobacteraceae bacterium]
MTDLSRIGARDALKSRKGDEPHWMRLRAGVYVGFRPSRKGGRGTWFARAFDVDARKYRRKALGDYGDFSGNDVFTAARKDAEAWGQQVESGGTRVEKMETVADACRAYLKVKPEASGAAGMLRRHVFSDPIASVRLDRLRRHHLREWRARLESKPALVSRNKAGEKRTRQRSAASVNRDMVPLRAALTRVLPPGAPGTDAAWQEAMKPAKGANRSRGLYLDREQRRKLLENIDQEALPFVMAMTLLPLRPGALAKLKVRDFDARTRTLAVGLDKAGAQRKIQLPENIAEFLVAQCKDKLQLAPLFMRCNGSVWNKDAWKTPINEAVEASGLPSGVTAYVLRHCVLTDLVLAGLPILTVAQLSGTSVQMIQAHYGHLVGNAAPAALAGLAL